MGGGQIGTPSKKGPRGGQVGLFRYPIGSSCCPGDQWPFHHALWNVGGPIWTVSGPILHPPGGQKSAKNVGGLLIFTMSRIPQRSPSWDPPRPHFPRPGGSHGRSGGSRGGLQTAQEGSGSRLGGSRALWLAMAIFGIRPAGSREPLGSSFRASWGVSRRLTTKKAANMAC